MQYRLALTIALAAALSGACLACGASDGNDPFGAVEPALEIGIGQDVFEAIRDRQRVELAEGAQGGNHLWLGFRVFGVAPAEARVEYSLERLDHQGPRQSAKVRFAPDEIHTLEAGFEYAGVVGVLSEPECWAGCEVGVEARLTTADGTMVVDEAVVVPVDHETTLEGATVLGEQCVTCEE